MNSTWQSILKSNFTSIEALADFLELPSSFRQQLLVKGAFPLSVPKRLANKMQKGTLDDPLARQFVSHILEDEVSEGFLRDPTHDADYQLTSKMLKKYEGRSLLVTTSACAMHCRYCFRQNFPYEKEKRQFEEEIDAIKSDPSIFEVILSGGDPLSLPDRRLALLLDEIDLIDHIRMIRFHTRFPIGIPERIDTAFLQVLEKVKKQIVFVIHANHKKEFDHDVLFALKQVQKLGVSVLCQMVLLKGVNDDHESLKELLLCLIENGIQPYYLHQLDPVIGSSRFHVSIEEGRALIEKLRGCLPGYAIPRYVQEIPGGLSKTPLS